MKKFFLIMLFISFFFYSCEDFNKKDKEHVTTTVEPGPGYTYFCEPVAIGDKEYYLQHSTLRCPAIKGGVLMNAYKSPRNLNLCCTKCMPNQGNIMTFDLKYHQIHPSDN